MQHDTKSEALANKIDCALDCYARWASREADMEPTNSQHYKRWKEVQFAIDRARVPTRALMSRQTLAETQG